MGASTFKDRQQVAEYGSQYLKGTSNYVAELKKNIETDSQFFLSVLYYIRGILVYKLYFSFLWKAPNFF